MAMPLRFGSVAARRLRSAPASALVGVGSGWCRSISSCRKSVTYSAVRIYRDGRRVDEKVELQDLLLKRGMRSRDISKVLQGGKKQDVTSPAVVPAGERLLVAIGRLRAIIGPESALVFHADCRSVQQWVATVCERLQRWEARNFELAILEEAIEEVVETYRQRVLIYRPVVDRILVTEKLSSETMQPLVTIRDSLSTFELTVRNHKRLLMELQSSDEDMRDLLISLGDDAPKEVETSWMQETELMLENFHRELIDVESEAKSLRRFVKSKQEAVAISLDLYRNRLMRLNVNVNICTLGMAVGTTIAGFFGMNLAIPGFLEQAPGAFMGTVAASSCFGLLLSGCCLLRVSGTAVQREMHTRASEVQAIQDLFGDMSRLDSVFRVANSERGLDRERLRALLSESRGTPVSSAEVDLFFQAFDASQDGVLHGWELRMMNRPLS